MEVVGLGAEEATGLPLSGVSSPVEFMVFGTVVVSFPKQRRRILIPGHDFGCVLGLRTSSPIVSIVQIPAAWVP